MDTLFQELPNSINGFKFSPVSFSPILNGCKQLSLAPHPLSESTPYPSCEGDFPNNNAILKYISDMLMEEDLEGKTCMLQDCLAFQAAEKSFYDVLGQEYPPASDQFLSCCNQNIDSPDGSFTWSSGSDNYTATNTLIEKSNFIFDDASIDLSSIQASLVDSPESALLQADFDGKMHPFQMAARGISDDGSLRSALRGNSLQSSDIEGRDISPGSRGRKQHQREDSDLEDERSNKHSALSLAEYPEQSEMFDEVLLCRHRTTDSISSAVNKPQNGATRNGGQRKGSTGRTARGKKQESKGELVDLWTLLTQCAQAVSISDHRTATELLKQIRQHSSPYGDGDQRLAHYVAYALETRLAGTSTPAYSPHLSNRTSMADILKAYQVYVKACPFKKMSNFFANRTISKLAEKATRLHIIDFGILYGFQWPCLIQRLSERPGGPPKLRITGIEFPQPGFRPAERVEETGRRLRKYCERFNVPFEYHVIAKKWETIKYKDLNIDGDEMTVVNCLYRLRNLPDDTLVHNSARDAVLNLIQNIKPDIFIHGVVNGTYNAPFFITRFREALFHFSSLFDMFDVNVAREDEKRRMFEKEIFAKDVMNVIACEGMERVERPETYKQWQARNLRAGFRQLPLDQEILKTVRSTVKEEYNRDFVVDEDGRWMLQGWKGRIIYALSVWKPSQE